METKEIKITPPEGFEIDKENSTFECIKFKPVVKRWRGIKDYIHGFYVSSSSKILAAQGTSNHADNYNLFVTEKQAVSALAMARISQVIANDERFGGVITDDEWKDNFMVKYTITRQANLALKDTALDTYAFLAFHTAGQRDLFLEENEDLVKAYLMIN